MRIIGAGPGPVQGAIAPKRQRKPDGRLRRDNFAGPTPPGMRHRFGRYGRVRSATIGFGIPRNDLPNCVIGKSRRGQMKPPAFKYVAAGTVEEATAQLAEYGGDARPIAGGQSLVPMMNFRLVSPAVLVDIRGIAPPDAIEEADGQVRIGALTRHRALEISPLIQDRFPVLSAAMTHVAHLAIRNRGTIGGSLCHADPAAELPAMAVLLDARIHVACCGGERIVEAGTFFRRRALDCARRRRNRHAH